MAEDLMREIHTQLNLITNDLAALPREDRIAWFRRTTYVQPLHFLKEINGTTYTTTVAATTAPCHEKIRLMPHSASHGPMTPRRPTSRIR